MIKILTAVDQIHRKIDSTKAENHTLFKEWTHQSFDFRVGLHFMENVEAMSLPADSALRLRG